MTSVAANASSAPSSAPQQQPTSPTSGSVTPQPAPAAAAAGRSYAGATNTTDRKSLGQSHGKSASISPAVPSIGGPTIANGNAGLAHSPGAHHGHSRKPSVTISPAGNSGQMPNGGPAVGQTPTGNGIQFGSVNNGPQSPGQSNMASQQDGGSLAVNNPANPRVTSPANSPSPIPQPATASGGRPPQSSLHQSTNSLSFGTFNNNDDAQRRSSVQGPMTPNMQNAHIRRDSNHSQHDANMGPGVGRGGFPPAGRGRGFNPNFSQQMPHSPSAGYRSLPPNGPRGPAGPNMGPQYGGRGAPPYGAPYSPAGRSPSLAHAQPAPPHQGQMPMPSPGMQQGYSYGPGGYGAPNVKNSEFPSSRKPKVKPVKGQRGGGRKKRDFIWPAKNATLSSSPSPVGPVSFPVFSTLPVYAPNSFSPLTNNFEHALTKNLQMQGHYDPNQGYYSQPYMQNQMPGMYMGPQNGYMPQVPNSPRPPYAQQNSGYGPNQYNQPPTMSRQGSSVSDRPGSTLGQPQQPPMTPSNHQQTPSRGANSPGPKSQFQIPVKKPSAAIKITNPNTGESVKFDKGAGPSPAPSGTPKAPESTPTPPPRTPSAQHIRTDSKAHKTSDEVKADLRDQIQAKIKADQEAAKRAREEEETRKRKEQDDEAEALRKAEEERKAAEEKAAREAKEAEEARLVAERAQEAQKQMEKQEAAQRKIEEEKSHNVAVAAAAEEPNRVVKPKAEDELKEPEMPDMDAPEEVWDEYDRQSAAYEAAKEAAYQKKKAASKAVEEAKAAEKAKKLDEELKAQEEEAERLEAEKEKARVAGEGDQDKIDAFAALKKSGKAFKATETSTEVLPEHSSAPGSGAETPKSDAASMPPPPSRLGSKPKPAALKLETQKQVEAAQPSAALQSLLSARRLTHFSPELYPSGVASPNPALNTSAKGSFRYDKDFLLQFQKVFTEKPSENWQEKLKETVGDTNDPPGSARGSRSSMGNRSVSQRGSVPSGFQGGMGNFGTSRTLPAGTTSEQRFAAASRPGGAPQGTIRYDPKGGFPSGFPMPIQRQGSNTLASPRPDRNDGGSRRGNSSKTGNKRHEAADAKNMPLTANMEIKPIEVSSTGWKPSSVGQRNTAGPPPGGENGYLAPDVVQRKVKASLNKMTPTTFEKIASQILDIVMQSKKETDGRTLRQVIQLTFEKATDEAHWAEMYAQFCGKMLSAMTPDIKDETLPKDKNGNVVNGSTLFRKYLLNRCQQDFEQGWQSKLPDKPEGSGEAALMSDEYYAAAAAKRRGLGLVRFIGELFKLGMLTARIMHMCVQKLVDFEGIPDEAEIESLTSLLKTIGADLDSDEKGHVLMDVYFGKIDEMMKVPSLPSRLKFMLMDIVDLRKASWKGKTAQMKGPSTIEQVHKEALAQQQAQEARAAQEQQQRRGGGGGGRPGVGRGDARNFSGPPPDYNSNRVGMDDLRRLGRGSNRGQGNQGPMGPTSMFNTRGSNKRVSTPGGIFAKSGADDSAASSRTGTPPIKSDKERREEAGKAAAGANAFSALAGLDSNESNDVGGSPATSPPMAKRPLPSNTTKSSDGA